MSKKWYLYKNKEQKGPFSWQEMVDQAASGGITASDMVWSEGMETWTKASIVEGLLPAAPSDMPPPPPVGYTSSQPPAAGTFSSSTPSSAAAGQATSTGLEPNIAALLSYILGWLTGIVFILIEKDNKFVRFHAMQSIIAFGGLTIVQILLGTFSTIIFSLLWRSGVGAWRLASTFSSLFGILSLLIWLGTIALAVFLMVKAYQNETDRKSVV